MKCNDLSDASRSKRTVTRRLASAGKRAKTPEKDIDKDINTYPGLL